MVTLSLASVWIQYRVPQGRTKISPASNPSYTNMTILTLHHRGVKVNEVAIVCTCKWLLPCAPNECICIMVPIKSCKKVEGTIVSPTSVVLHYRKQYEGFTIKTNTDNGDGTFTLLDKNPVHSITYPMTLRNGLWFHEYDPEFRSRPTVNLTLINNLWHGRWAHAGEGVMDDIHYHVTGIGRPLKRNPFNKYGSC